MAAEGLAAQEVTGAAGLFVAIFQIMIALQEREEDRHGPTDQEHTTVIHST